MSDKEYSKWGLLNIYYDAKRRYYVTGKPSMTDIAYDNLECSIEVLHGKELLKEYGTVGYDPEKHQEIKDRFKKEKDKFRGEFNKK